MREANDQLALLRSNWQPLRNNWRKPKSLKIKRKKPKLRRKRQKPRLRKKKMRPSSMAMMSAWVRAEVTAVCRAYCAQTWEEALNRAGIDASSELRRPKNIFFLPTIRAPGLAPNQRKQPLQSPSQLRMLNFRILPLLVNMSRPKNLKLHKGPPRTR